MEQFADPYFFFKRQMMWGLLGFGAMICAMYIDYQTLQRWVYPLLLCAILLLLLVCISPLGKEVGGAKRWVQFGSLSFQPSEFAKLVMVLYLAHSLTKKRKKLQSLRQGYIPYVLIMGIVIFLLLLQPDLGTALIIVVVSFTLLFIGGVRPLHLTSSVLLSLPLVFLVIIIAPYRIRRILAFLDPWSDPLDAGFQIIQSLVALGKGGIVGLGLGEGKQKLFFLPAPHTDFIFAVIGEELGFMGGMVLLLCFSIFLWRGIAIAFRTRDLFGMHLAFGIVFLIIMQVIINVAVVVGLLPTKGLPLPFVSLGGSSLIANMLGVGILLSVSVQREAKACGS
jgi:cell division protein FtsW